MIWKIWNIFTTVIFKFNDKEAIEYYLTENLINNSTIFLDFKSKKYYIHFSKNGGVAQSARAVES